PARRRRLGSAGDPPAPRRRATLATRRRRDHGLPAGGNAIGRSAVVRTDRTAGIVPGIRRGGPGIRRGGAGGGHGLGAARTGAPGLDAHPAAVAVPGVPVCSVLRNFSERNAENRSSERFIRARRGNFPYVGSVVRSETPPTGGKS